MLTYLAARDPGILHSLGISAEFVKHETARATAAAKWRSMQQADKRTADEAAWRAWLEKYLARLGREKQAGAVAEQRQALMNRTNPRIVLRNWVRTGALEGLGHGSEARQRTEYAVSVGGDSLAVSQHLSPRSPRR